MLACNVMDKLEVSCHTPAKVRTILKKKRYSFITDVAYTPCHSVYSIVVYSEVFCVKIAELCTFTLNHRDSRKVLLNIYIH